MLMSYYEYLNEAKSHTLSGVVLLYNNKILLVRPKKFKNKMKKWSIPKGHIENNIGKAKTALKELKEESRIKLKKNQLKNSKKITIKYSKSGVEKTLTCYIVKINEKDLNIKLFNDMILGNFLKGETVEAGFFTKEDANMIIEKQQKELLKYLD